MIPYNLADRLIKSKHAFTIGALIVIGFLAEEYFRKDFQHTAERVSWELSLQKKDSIIYAMQQQDKTHADLDVRAALQNAAEYRELWLKMVEIKSEVQKTK